MVLDPIIDGYHFTRVLMDGGSSLNLIYQDTIRKMGIDPPKIKIVNVLHMMKGRNKAALLETHAPGPITAEFCHWSSQPITFDHRDYSASIRRA